METLHSLIDPKVMAASVTGFIILWIVLARYLFKPVLTLLDERKEEIKTTYESAEAERKQAEDYRADYEKRLAQIEAEARTHIQTAIREAEDAKNHLIAEARRRSEEILRRGQEELAREREKIIAQIREEIVNMSLAAASKLIEESLDEQKHRKLISDFIESLESVQ